MGCINKSTVVSEDTPTSWQKRHLIANILYTNRIRIDEWWTETCIY